MFTKRNTTVINKEKTLLPLLDLNTDLDRMQDFDKLVVLEESLKILKLQELNRLVNKYGPSSLDSKIFDKKIKVVLETYFGLEEAKSIIRVCRA